MIAAIPCPFCDGRTTAAQSPISQEWRISCVECWSAGPPSTSEQRSIERWNARVALTEVVRGEIALRLQERNRFIDMPTMRAIVDEALGDKLHPIAQCMVDAGLSHIKAPQS